MGLRRSIDRNVLVWEDHSNFVGVCCGWDYTAEHEWGIKDLQRDFGIDQTKIGLERRKITKCPHVGLDEHLGVSYLWHQDHCSWNKEPTKLPDYYRKECEPRPSQNTAAGWGEESFCFAGRDKKVKRQLGMLYEAFQRLDAVIYIGKAEVFGNGGLILAIASKLPAEIVANMTETDLDAAKLKRADEATGIKPKLEQAGKRYIALRPRWKSNNDSQTKHPIVYWLNPMSQDVFNYGWYTVEELEQWIDGKGPIPNRVKTNS